MAGASPSPKGKSPQKKPSNHTTSSSTTAFGGSKEDIAFAVYFGLIAVGAVLSFLSFRTWSHLEAPKVDPKLTKAQQLALATAWEPFVFATWNDGQLGASLLALAFVCFSAAAHWKRDKGRALAVAAVFFLVYPVLNGFSLWLPISFALSGLCGYGAIVFSSPVGRTDVVQSIHSVAARILFLVDAALLIYAEILRLQSPDVAVTTVAGLTPAVPSVDPVQHRAARLALAVGFLIVTIGSDVHAYRGMLKIGAWVWTAALCPCLGVYTGSSKYIIIIGTSALILAHVIIHCTFPFNMPILQFFRRWQSDMNRVVRGTGDD